MDKKTTGAWVVHHSQKLQSVNLPTPDYDQVSLAGKCGILLNALAGSQEMELPKDRVRALAKANGISTTLELPTILAQLEKQRLIDCEQTCITVLGVTSAQILEYTASIFEESSPSQSEQVALDFAEKVSAMPLLHGEAAEYVSDTFHLSTKDTREVLHQYSEIGFIDSEAFSGENLYFNGNLFRHEDAAKIGGVISSLTPQDESKLTEFSAKLRSAGCIQKREAVKILDGGLYSKLCAIGFIDENTVGNESGTFSFVTNPASFSKFTNSAVDDAFDLAKAFVTSLTYGMTKSSPGRGRIFMIEKLMRRLIEGSLVGPATAIGHDYKILEIKGVIKLNPAGDGRFYMRLLKREVGELALLVITQGEASGESLLQLPSVSATKYSGPEVNRVITRKKQAEPLRRSVAELLNDLRTGGIR
jgi:hypothetical protein